MSNKHKIKIIGLGAGLPDKADLRANGPLLWLPLLRDCQVICASRGLLDLLQASRNELWPDTDPARQQPSPLFIPIDARLEALAARLTALRDQGDKICVLAGGDPLFYGIGSSLTRYFSPDELEILPGVSSMQEACARLALPWTDLRHISLHGRSDWQDFDCAALTGHPICLLLDEKHSLLDLATRLLERGRAKYRLHYFGGLGSAKEQHLEFDSEELCQTGPGQKNYLKAAAENLAKPGLVLLLPKTSSREWPRPFMGMPDNLFQHEAGLISKQPVRAAALAALRLRPWHSLLDIGAGCGSVGIEACALLPEGRVYALEKHPARVAQILFNRQALGAVNLEVVQAEAEEAIRTNSAVCPPANGAKQSAANNPAQLPASGSVDRIFIGGGLSGEKGCKLLEAAWAYLAPGGRLTAACVLLGSLETCRRGLERLVMQDRQAGRDDQTGQIDICSIQAGLGAALAGDTQIKALNQVFILSADKKK